jgi:hypothetical protein
MMVTPERYWDDAKVGDECISRRSPSPKRTSTPMRT